MMSFNESLPYGPGSTVSFSAFAAFMAAGNVCATATTQPVHLPIESSTLTALMKPGIFFASVSSIACTFEP